MFHRQPASILITVPFPVAWRLAVLTMMFLVLVGASRNAVAQQKRSMADIEDTAQSTWSWPGSRRKENCPLKEPSRTVIEAFEAKHNARVIGMFRANVEYQSKKAGNSDIWSAQVTWTVALRPNRSGPDDFIAEAAIRRSIGMNMIEKSMPELDSLIAAWSKLQSNPHAEGILSAANLKAITQTAMEARARLEKLKQKLETMAFGDDPERTAGAVGSIVRSIQGIQSQVATSMARIPSGERGKLISKRDGAWTSSQEGVDFVARLIAEDRFSEALIWIRALKIENVKGDRLDLLEQRARLGEKLQRP